MDTKGFEHIKTWKRGGFRLELFDTYKRVDGKCNLAYRLFDAKELIFEGDDFYASPMHAIDSLDAVYSLLVFLSLRPGDTDSEYFEHYTPRQLEWCNARAETLGSMIPDKYM